MDDATARDRAGRPSMIELRLSREVASAREEWAPLVGLESVIVAHGLPRPMNLDVARECEGIVREEGATPATLALHDGALKVGLESAELKVVAGADNVAKVNLGNLAAVLARGGWGATTVSTSLWACDRAGISVLVTGGIGGVHRGFHETFDISSDLTALARFPVVVVCSGVKSLLDVGATREHLETLGVPVLGWNTTTFPRFYMRESQYGVDAVVAGADEVARIARMHWETGGKGIVVGVPVPEDDEIIEAAFEENLLEAEYERLHSPIPIEGRDVTPFILDRLHKLTGGATLRSNTALIRNNVRVGAKIAVAMTLMGKSPDEAGI
jgi:pseudouridine-5'-phosphate glycosidase